MKEVEKLVKKIVKKLGDKDARYFYGVEYSHDSPPDYRIRIIPTKIGTQPVIIGAATENALVDQLNQFIETADHDTLAVQYCEHEIRQAEESIIFHKNVIKEYEKKNADTSS